MNLLEQLQSHRGGLLHLKTELFWYDGRGHDKDPDRLCLLLDVITADADTILEPVARTYAAVVIDREATAVTLLLIDGRPQWIWVAEQDIEVIDESR